MKLIFLIIAFLIVVFVFETTGESTLPSNVNSIINAVLEQNQKQNIAGKIIPISNIPIEIFDICHLPFLDQGTIASVNDVGLVWCSSSIPDSCNIGDSCYVVIKVKSGYLIEWWKRSSRRWYYIRTQHANNVSPSLKTKDRDW